MDARVVFILAVFGIAQCSLIDSCSNTRSFVDGHNERRLQLAKGQVYGQPAASRMTYMVWDDELATKAEKWASRNRYELNPDNTLRSKRFVFGQNIFMHETENKNFKFDPEIAMEAWWSENENYIYGRLSQKSTRTKIGGYTQMAWEKSTSLGCGISKFYKHGVYNFLVVCFYGPQGNIVGEVPYKSGRASDKLVCVRNMECNNKYGSDCFLFSRKIVKNALERYTFSQTPSLRFNCTLINH